MAHMKLTTRVYEPLATFQFVFDLTNHFAHIALGMVDRDEMISSQPILDLLVGGNYSAVTAASEVPSNFGKR